MGGFNAANLFGSGGLQIAKTYKNYFSDILDTGGGPLLPLPGDWDHYTFNNAVFEFTYYPDKPNAPAEKIKIKALSAAKLNENLTDYCNECFRTFVTIEFIRLVGQFFT